MSIKSSTATAANLFTLRVGNPDGLFDHFGIHSWCEDLFSEYLSERLNLLLCPINGSCQGINVCPPKPASDLQLTSFPLKLAKDQSAVCLVVLVK